MLRRRSTSVITPQTQPNLEPHGFIWSFVLLSVTILVLVLTYNRLPPEVPLFFNQVHGERQLVNKPFIILLPALSAIFFLTHLWLVKLKFSQDTMFFRLLSLSSLIVTFLFSMALFHIILILI